MLPHPRHAFVIFLVAIAICDRQFPLLAKPYSGPTRGIAPKLQLITQLILQFAHGLGKVIKNATSMIYALASRQETAEFRGTAL